MITPLAAPGNTSSAFILCILGEDWDSLKLGYTWDTMWPILTEVYQTATQAEVSVNDVESYNWDNQTMALTLPASSILKTKFKASSSLDVAAKFGTPHRAFVVTADGSPVYGGVFLELGSQMAIKYPVIYIESRNDGRLVLTIRPIHTVGDMIQLSKADPRWRSIRREQIREIFAATGKLLP